MFRRKSLFLFSILVIAFFFRVIFLDRIPSGISNDELDYLLNAKSVFLSGSDITHTWNPLSLSSPKNTFPKAEFPPLVAFWLVGPLPLSLFTSKLIYALISVGTVWLIYLITKRLIGEKEAWVAGLVGAVNPWLIFFGRTAYDSQIAIFFFLLGLYILLISRKWKILFSFPAFFFAFYTYIGTKLIFLPFVCIVITFSWMLHKKYIKHYVLLFLLCAGVFGYYTFSVLHTPGSRVNELATPSMDTIAATVNNERRLSIHSPLTPVFSNKYVVFGKYAAEKYFNAFSPSFLFLNGDGKSLFTLRVQGSFYYLDALFLLIGFAVLFATNTRVLFLLSAIVLLAPIPSVLSTVDNSYAVRSFLLAPVFIIFIGVGISYVIKKYRYVWIFIGIIYIVFIANFINIYFFRNPLYNSESFSFSSRELIHYLSLQSGKSVFVINDDPSTPYKQYLFYQNALTKNTANQVATEFQKKQYSIGNIRFIPCHQVHEITPGSVVVFSNCKKLQSSSTDVVIAQLGDSGAVYTIKNDSICSQYKLNRYIYGITFADLRVENLSTTEFCQKFVTRY